MHLTLRLSLASRSPILATRLTEAQHIPRAVTQAAMGYRNAAFTALAMAR
jgi:hypothetical protein